MSNAYDHENTPAAGYGEFDPFGIDDWTDEDWAAYDEQVAAEIEAFDAAEAEFFWDLDAGEPPF